MDWVAAKHTLRYLVGTSGHVTLIGNVNEEEYDLSKSDSALSAIFDTDWARDIQLRKSTSGNGILYNGRFLSWRLGKQSCVTSSSTESEYTASSKCIQKLRFHRHLLFELGEVKTFAVVYEDNQACISWAVDERK